ncbi:MAG: hypothetical protein HY835_10365 [Anaerolineae bacterium]|nr:hypothetical protein [Anaerolineae bacterium]
MTIVIAEERQGDVNGLRIDLAQAKIDLAEVRVSDEYSMRVKERVLDGLNKITRELDALGVMHSAAIRQHCVRRVG